MKQNQYFFRFCQGGFLKKTMEKDKSLYEYKCENNSAKDFMTLLRNIILTKFTIGPSFHVRMFLSSSGEN